MQMQNFRSLCPFPDLEASTTSSSPQTEAKDEVAGVKPWIANNNKE